MSAEARHILLHAYKGRRNPQVRPAVESPFGSPQRARALDCILILPRIGARTIRLTHLATARLWQTCRRAPPVTFSSEEVAVLPLVRPPRLRQFTWRHDRGVVTNASTSCKVSAFILVWLSVKHTVLPCQQHELLRTTNCVLA